MQNYWDIQNLADEYTESWYRYSKGIEYPYYRENEEDEEDEETEWTNRERIKASICYSHEAIQSNIQAKERLRRGNV